MIILIIPGTAYEVKANLRMKQEETSGRSNGILLIHTVI